MAQVKGLTTAQVIAAARAGREGISKSLNIHTYPVDSFRARYGYSGAPVGRMPKSWAAAFRARYGAGKVTQVLVSFQTAIAWRDEDYGWVMPDVTYSIITTIRHQGPARGGWNNPGLGDIVSPAMPWDATPEDAARVLSGELIFYRAGKYGNGDWAGTRPGPNYRAA